MNRKPKADGKSNAGASSRPARAPGAQILILPRSQVLRREFVLPTCNPKEVGTLLRYRIPAECPFLIEEIAWSWEATKLLADGSYLVRVNLVEKARLELFLDDAGIGPELSGLLVEDEFLSLWQGGSGASKAAKAGAQDSSPSEALHFYLHQQRLLAMLVEGERCIRSDVQALNGSAIAPETIDRMLDQMLVGLHSGFPSFREAAAGTVPIRMQKSLVFDSRQARDNLAWDLENPLAEVDPEVPASKRASKGRDALQPLAGGGWLLSPGLLKDRLLVSRLRAQAGKDILPETWQKLAAGRRFVRRMLYLTGFCLLMTGAFYVLSDLMVKKDRSARQEIDRSRAELQAELEQVQAAEMMIQDLKNWSVEGREILDTWNRVSARVPQGVALSGLAIQGNGRLSIQGSSSSRDGLVEFMESMRGDDSKLFTDLVLGGLEDREGKQSFHILARLPGQERQAAP